MRVTLAYAYDGHWPDETVDLPDGVARRLLFDGRARKPAPDIEATPEVPTPPKRGSGRRTKETR